MTNSENSEQLDINLGGRRNRLKEALHKGEFVLLVEAPSADQLNGESRPVPELVRELEDAVLKMEGGFCGLFIHDNPEGDCRSIETASLLQESEMDRHLVCISGSGTALNECIGLANRAKTMGVRNVLAVSGSAKNAPAAESTVLLRELAAWKEEILTACAVNPYQHTGFSVISQFHKLESKLAAGAGLAVAQAGWDMLSLQSLAWYMTSHELFQPRLARLMLLSPLRLERILAGEMPGVRVSEELKNTLERELRYSKNQFEATQYRRLALQAAGCRLMGFNGIQLAGADSPLRAKVAAERIRAALAEFHSLDVWLREYNQSSGDAGAFWSGYRPYDRLLQRGYPDETEGKPQITPPEDTMRRGEKLRHDLAEICFAEADLEEPERNRFMKKILCGCPGCQSCQLPQWEYVCIRRCPKRLNDGACGDLNPDGSCPATGEECCFHKAERFRLELEKQDV